MQGTVILVSGILSIDFLFKFANYRQLQSKSSDHLSFAQLAEMVTYPTLVK